MQKYQFLIKTGRSQSVTTEERFVSHVSTSPSKSVLARITKLAQYDAREDSALREFRRKLQAVTNR